MINFAEAPAVPGVPGDLQALTRRLFSKEGWLCSELGLEHRPQQESMACAVACALMADEPLLCEAGTGVGKSLAYLLPGLIHAIRTERPLLVSSHTIALQQQIEKKDLALCRTLFHRVRELRGLADFRVALLVGRANYLCGHRLMRAIETKTDLFGGTGHEELQRIVDWSQVTDQGLREELQPTPSPEVWEWVNADSGACNRRNCTPETCFYRRAMARRAEANIIILNHSLLFSLLAAGLSPAGEVPGVLYPQDFLVLDEAHTVPDTATGHFGIAVSSFGVARLLRRLYHTSGGKARGLLAKIGDRQDQTAVLRATAEAEQFFNEVRTRFLRRSGRVRLHQPDWIGPQLARPFGEVIRRLKTLAGDDRRADAREELLDQAGRLQDHLAAIHACTELRDSGHVYWLERGGRDGLITYLRSAPLDVAPVLRAKLFERGTGVVLTSATLTSGGRMEPFQERAGAIGLEQLVEQSPFDYERRMQIFVATDAPQPSAREGRLDIEYLAEMVTFCVERVAGGSLVLFTSYADLQAVAARAEAALQKQGRQLMIQGGGRSRSAIKADFAALGNGVLFGTDSFWTGFDVPGPALSQVVITRLPFENPGDPVREARGEALAARGGHPFTEITLPEAAIKFRQGVGRLIRSQEDQGIITILDSRLLTKPYGRYFLESLPKKTFVRLSRSNRDEVFPAGP